LPLNSFLFFSWLFHYTGSLIFLEICPVVGVQSRLIGFVVDTGNKGLFGDIDTDKIEVLFHDQSFSGAES